MQDNCFVPMELPPVYFPSRGHACEAEHRRQVVLFHIEGMVDGVASYILCIHSMMHVA